MTWRETGAKGSEMVYPKRSMGSWDHDLSGFWKIHENPTHISDI
jgi:hypothetical protein